MLRQVIVAAGLVAGLSVPVAAQNYPPVEDILAVIIGGLAPGATAEMPVRGIVESPAAGEFTITGEGTVVSVKITEPSPCVFAMESAIPEYPTVTLHIDANRITAMSVIPSGERDDLHRYDLTIAGKGAVTIETPDGKFPAPEGPTQIISTIPLDWIEQNIEMFHEYCPGLAG